MIQKSFAGTVNAVPKDLPALIVGWEHVIVDAHAFQHLLGDDVDAGFVFPGSSVSDPSDTLLAGVNGLENRQLVEPR